MNWNDVEDALSSNVGYGTMLGIGGLGLLGLHLWDRSASNHFKKVLENYNKKNKLSNRMLNNIAQRSGTGVKANPITKKTSELMFGGEPNAAYVYNDINNSNKFYDALKLPHDKNAEKVGAIIYDKKFRNPAIMAHEYGHAESRKNGTAPNQLVSAGLGLGSILGIAGIAAYMRNSGVGIGKQLAVTLPSLFLTNHLLMRRTVNEEERASENARRYLKGIKRTNSQLEADEKLLDAALNTYDTAKWSRPLKAVAGSLAITGGIGLLNNHLNNY